MGDDRDAISSANLAYLTALHEQWLEDPETIDPTFAGLFSTLGHSLSPISTSEEGNSLRDTSSRDAALRYAYRQRGHFIADLDPLGLAQNPEPEDLNPAGANPALRAALRRAYCGTLAVEFMHIQSTEQRDWWIERFENSPDTSPAPHDFILQALTDAEGFEAFCQKRFKAMRRFGLEGGESLVVALRAILEHAATDEAASISIGMPHRGRLNVMANVLHKPFEAIFNEFRGGSFKPEDIGGSGDVKYHLGTATTIDRNGHQIRLSLLPNPSHLEAINPVVLGRIRADQDQNTNPRHHHRQRTTRDDKHLGVLVHGDAAFSGQGVVYETLMLSQLAGYRTGGTLHLIINNQIGFTTVPEDNFSGTRGTDIAKAIEAPILHVNGDDPEAVFRAATLAYEWRKAFSSDIVLDIVCYRRFGHNETDEPAFTQPTMVRAIRTRPSVRRLYADSLVQRNLSTDASIEQRWEDTQNILERAFSAAPEYRPDPSEWLDTPQNPTRLEDEPERIQPMTGVPLNRLLLAAEGLSTIPEGMNIHPRLARQITARGETIAAGKPLDWASCEALAFGTLSMDGHPVRLSGQDSRRGTFSQRHAVLIDQETGREETPLANLAPHQAPLHFWNSPLSEYAVLGFEYGYSLGNPDALVVWEAQFGDFVNGAQIILDQFVASGETKWLRTSGLVLLLPHGHEGGGPEHSSARPERILQLCAENNLRVCNISTPANYFHALRRQIARRCRKPLIVFTPKSLLRHKETVSPLDDMGPQTRFNPVLADPDYTPNATRIILCTGKVYYDLLAERRRVQNTKTALIRLEQLYPFPSRELQQELAQYPQLQEVIWCQEEPENNGAWHFVDRRIERVLTEMDLPVQRPAYVGRPGTASPATGLTQLHNWQQDNLVQTAIGGG
ncbi:2-oxoglutarate dehydrogenase E1 [Neokomagataea thailandica NBRC 106555]|uniref:2-oxoglutarate dehydrogenase E1 component n=2 Tax=Neokomagataea TaxID=1223423 RepID=A0A4Y6V6Q0_9PROT|nr:MULTISPECIES: 2-oxoglutarate dehydrogenase E1 component [Neokomagataea]QDH24538.1 2-oxoglutarate dehydrogenase E1 component [Neokomagataea tanensis]GBR51749.1 2-oxoglutarate dehydrogenase E1 [Neokomagataea thailandica NBRC 106555]